ncbi:hypothetical protein [Phocaeicola coprocola]|uniref:hypothetical protein n=1 Tax=Phocaeicola coprocola TaxID=310298 RepID=UPI003AF061B4
MVFKIWKITAMVCGGLVGWMIGEFKPAFLLTVVVYVAWTAFKLDKRVRTAYPDKTQRKQAKFTSFAFGKVVKQTIPKRLMLIILAFLEEHWVFIHVTIPLSYVVTGAICFEQFWSILQNESSCRPESESRFWKLMQQIMVDKTECHLDVNLNKLKH